MNATTTFWRLHDDDILIFEYGAYGPQRMIYVDQHRLRLPVLKEVGNRLSWISIRFRTSNKYVWTLFEVIQGLKY